jgi:hypothetical protein
MIGMYGYILGLVFALFLLAICIAGFTRSAPAASGRATSRRKKKPVQRQDPSADEPTPDRSRTASSRQVSFARRHTPPA